MPRTATLLLPPADAWEFIAGYKAVMLEVLAATGRQRSDQVVQDLHAARTLVQSDTQHLAAAIEALRQRGSALGEDMEAALHSLRIGRWFHLRRTVSHAVLLDARAEHAYAVKALTDPLHQLAGGPAVSFEAGLLEYRGRYVCDGLVAGVVHLGPGVRADLNEALARIRFEGRFHAVPGRGG